ncbi:MAG: thermonuclease family protein [Deltaproteobacteria bacterium]|nr:MAG: thermonuclease family protein [Deltaproteobacteria bacterium]
MQRYALTVLALTLLAACDNGSSGAATDTVADDTAADATTETDTTPVETDTVDPNEPRDLVVGAVAHVYHIVDGDTMYLAVGNTAPQLYDVRITGLSAPECKKKQTRIADGTWWWVCSSDDEFYGLASLERAQVLAPPGMEVTVSCDDLSGRPLPTGTWCPQDDFDRYLVYVKLADGQDFATQMAWNGAGMSYTWFPSSKRAAICGAEYDAIDNERGMWGAGPVSTVISRMNDHTQYWYNTSHDKDCDKALGL